jgi:two-component system phosphate regulon sensor histidine kinase PhoR
MAAQAGRMARLIDDLLSLSRIELNEHIAPEGRVDVVVAVLDVLDALTPLAAERGVSFRTRLAPRGSAMIVGDRDQILQVAQNLIDNAVKYTPGGGTVEVEVAENRSADEAIAPTRPGAARLSLLSPDLMGGERFVVLRCADIGPGIAREYLPRLSERFYRVEGQKSGERLGTGLGLAIVKHIINRHRGGLAIESAEGQGTTFTAYLPWLS